MFIRKAEDEDAIAIHAVFIAAVLSVLEYSEDERRSWAEQLSFEEVRSRIEEGLTWVAEDEEFVVGFITLKPEHEELRSIYVHVDYQNKGVGGALMERAIEEARDMSWRGVHLKASRNGIGFYESYGFEKKDWGSSEGDDGSYGMCTRMIKGL